MENKVDIHQSFPRVAMARLEDKKKSIKSCKNKYMWSTAKKVFKDPNNTPQFIAFRV